MNIVAKLESDGVAHPPKFLSTSIHYLANTGSNAYGVANSNSDYDVNGFCIPPLDDIFPHIRGEIMGFGTHKNRFEQYQEHHLTQNGREYDFTVYSIVKYFHLTMENNPNMVDSLFVPTNCVLQITDIGVMVRDNRRLFLHKGSYHKFRGYAYAQLSKIENKSRTTGVRKEIIEKYGYDTKFAYHVVRLLLECEQILQTGEMDLQRDRELYKAIRSGEWSLAQVQGFFDQKQKYLEQLYQDSTLPYNPDENAIKQLLLNCLEHHFGSLDKVLVRVESTHGNALEDIIAIAQKALGQK